MLTHTNVSIRDHADTSRAAISSVAVDTSPTRPLTIKEVSDSRPGVKILKLAGPLTIHNFSPFQDMTEPHLLPQILFVDLSDVPYIDSAALGSFVAIHVACEATNRKYALVGASERLKNLFDLAYVRTFLNIYDSIAEAEAHLLSA